MFQITTGKSPRGLRSQKGKYIELPTQPLTQFEREQGALQCNPTQATPVQPPPSARKGKAPFRWSNVLIVVVFYAVAGLVAAFIALTMPELPRPVVVGVFVVLAAAATLAAWWWATPEPAPSMLGCCEHCKSRNVTYGVDITKDRKPTLFCNDCNKETPLA